MQINRDVPEEIARNIGEDARSVERAALEGLALEGIRSSRPSRGQVWRLLGFETRYEVDGFPMESLYRRVSKRLSGTVNGC